MHQILQLAVSPPILKSIICNKYGHISLLQNLDDRNDQTMIKPLKRLS